LSKLDAVYMKMAQEFSKNSKAVRLKVGAMIVTTSGVILPGYNGTPSGLSNECEHKNPDGILTTKSEVIHAELNCVLKAASEGVSIKGSDVFITHSPCLQCSSMLIQSRVKRVVFGRHYRDDSGIILLKQAGVTTEQLLEDKNELQSM